MNEFYTYFFIRQILQILIFLSDIDSIAKIFIIMLVDLTGKYKPFFNPTQLLNHDKQDRVVLTETIGSVFTYFQILILIIENKLFTKSQLFIILGALLLHICSIMNYLYEVPNGESSLEKGQIFPDLFIPILVVFLFYNYIQKNK
jgi:hypothetical protein